MPNYKNYGKESENRKSRDHRADAKHKRNEAPSQRKKKPVNKLLLIGAGVIAVLVTIFLINSGGSSEKKTLSNDPPLGADFETTKTKGNASAPVTIIEYSDFQCSACASFYRDILPRLESEYVSAGKVRIQYKHFPLDSIHAQATPAALASECAREQGRFWEYHDVLFQNQPSLREGSYKVWAERLGLDREQFSSCYDQRRYASQVRAEAREGAQAGVSSTPTLIVNGRTIRGVPRFEALRQIIEAELQE